MVDPDMMVDPAQAAAVAARRREVRADEARRERHRAPQSVTTGMFRFTATCRVCAQRFPYEAGGLVLADGKPRPIAPARVCDRKACLATVHAEIEAEREAASAAVRVEQAATYARVVPPKYHRAARIAPACDDHLIAQLKPWRPGMSVYLHGPPSSGKGHQVAALMQRAVTAGSIAWVSTRRLVADAKAAIGDPSRRRPAIIDNPCGVLTLVLDDVFAEVATEYATNLVGDIVSARYDADLAILFTSNIAPSMIPATVDSRRSDAASVRVELERTLARILEMTAPPGGVSPLRVEGIDWRADIARGVTP